MRGHARPVAALAALVLTGGGLAACGDDEETPAGGGGGKPAASAPAKLSVEVTGSTKKDLALKVPATGEAGLVEVTLTNNATKGEHSLHLIRVDGDLTLAEAMKAGNAWGGNGKPLPDELSFVGGIGVVEQGASRTSTMQLEPGRYALLDFNNDGGGELVEEVTLEGGGAGGELPQADAAVVAKDYTFEAENLKGGNNVIRWENAGDEPHHLVAAPLKPGKTIEDVKQAFESEDGPPPFDEERMVELPIISGGEGQVAELELESGEYAMVCFIPDRAGGPPHIARGMVAGVTVE